MNTWEEYKKENCVEVDENGMTTIFKKKISPNIQRGDGRWSTGVCNSDLEDVWDYQQEKINLMNTSTGFLDWTEEWENALFFGSRKIAKADRDYIGLTNASVVTYKIERPVKVETKLLAAPDPYCVYIIAERHDNQCEKSHCKIGYSKDPVARLKQLQTGHSSQLGLEGWFSISGDENTARQEEANLHNTFDNKRVRGEWFELDDEIREFIRESHKHNPHFVRYFS
jgi:hypothetical protein